MSIYANSWPLFITVAHPLPHFPVPKMSEDDRAAKAARAKAMVDTTRTAHKRFRGSCHVHVAQETTGKEGRANSKLGYWHCYAHKWACLFASAARTRAAYSGGRWETRLGWPASTRFTQLFYSVLELHYRFSKDDSSSWLSSLTRVETPPPPSASQSPPLPPSSGSNGDASAPLIGSLKSENESLKQHLESARAGVLITSANWSLVLITVQNKRP